MRDEKGTSLESYFRRQTIRWSLVSFVVATAIAAPILFYAQKNVSERQLLTVARAAATAYRPMILQGDVRDAEIQMQTALGLKAGESAVVRNAKLKEIYSVDPKSPVRPNCFSPNVSCWSPHFRSVSMLYPLYFDEPGHKNLFGYLDLTLKPALDYNILFCLLFVLFGAFVGNTIGIFSAIGNATRKLSSLFQEWAKHLKDAPSRRIENRSIAPFTDLAPMKEAVDGLHLEIRRLQEVAANEARALAHFGLLREIGHDLKTPHSRLAMQVENMVSTIELTGRYDTEEIARVKRSISQLGDIIRLVRYPLIKRASSDRRDSVILLKEEVSNYISSLRDDHEFLRNNVQIDFFQDGIVPPANINKIEFYRVLENIVQNSIAAMAECEEKTIEIRITNADGRPTMIVKDCGCGIPIENRERIFEVDFTTKPLRGTGIGLGVVKGICDSFNATISFSSEVGRGTEFFISFCPANIDRGTERYEVAHAQT